MKQQAQQATKPTTVSVVELANSLQIDEFDLRLALDSNGIENADTIQTITSAQATAVRAGYQRYMQGQGSNSDTPSLQASSPTPPSSPGSSLVQSHSQIQSSNADSDRLVLGVVQAFQQLGLERKVIEGHQQSLAEIGAYEAGRIRTWENYAQYQMQHEVEALEQLGKFDVEASLAQAGITLPKQSLSNLTAKSAETLQRAKQLRGQYVTNPWNR